MKVEFTDVSETRKNLVVEVPSADVDREIERLSQQYRRSVHVQGFRPGKAPARLILQRMRKQILHEVAHDLIPRAVDEALNERGLEPVEAPSIRDVNVEEGQSLTFTATFDTLPSVDPGEYRGLILRRTRVELTEEAVTEALEQLREQAARAEPVEGRGIAQGDTVTVSLERQIMKQPAVEGSPTPAEPEHHVSVEVVVGASANPPGFDEHLLGLEVGTTSEFTLTYPDEYEVKELSRAEVRYSLTVTAIHQRVLPTLDDEFARNLGKFDSLDALREQARADLGEQADHDADRRMRDELLTQLATRVAGEVPKALVDREVDRRVEHFVTHLINQRIDPRRANIDWEAFRNEQRAAATDTVRSSLVLDEIARHEKLDVSAAELEEEVARQADRGGRTVSATRELLEKERGVALLAPGLRREKAIDFVMAHATIVAV